MSAEDRELEEIIDAARKNSAQIPALLRKAREHVLMEVADSMELEEYAEHPFDALDDTVTYLREKAKLYGEGVL